jgi:methylated-DNA-protein-cysteine methyltransferase related protein
LRSPDTVHEVYLLTEGESDRLHLLSAKRYLENRHEFMTGKDEKGLKPDLADRASRAELVIERVRAIPKGYVRTYGDIDARAPRFVGRILATKHDLPWHRVVRADGTLPKGQRQRELLLGEGVPMRGDRVDLDQARLPPEL